MSRVDPNRFRRRALCAGSLALVALIAAGCGGGGGGGAAPAAAEIAEGEVLYQKTCATCHGTDGHGMPRLGKDLHDNEFTRSMSDDEMLEFLKQGRPAWHPDNTQGVDMPPRGGNPALTDDDLRKIIAFQRTWSPR